MDTPTQSQNPMSTTRSYLVETEGIDSLLVLVQANNKFHALQQAWTLYGIDPDSVVSVSAVKARGLTRPSSE